jgi:histidine triad (HIT) family protein
LPSPSPASPAAGCRFCAIVAGEEHGHVVFEDADSLAFLDNRPLFPGHALLVPRVHYQTIWDLPDELVGSLFCNAKLLSAAVREAMGAKGAFVALNNVVSQSVPHCHIHVVPRNPKDGLRGFFWPRTKYEDEDHMRATAEAIRSALHQGEGS